MPELDLLIRGGEVVDGRQAPGPPPPTSRSRDGRVVEVSDHVDGDAARVLDADGLLVTPGFVDVHTHYDAQLHWEPTASPASWHGVTTLLTGNCGFTLAPCQARRPGVAAADAEPGRGHVRRRAGDRGRLPRRVARRLPRPTSTGASAVNVGRQRRALRPAPLRDGRRGVRASRDRRRGRRDAAAAPRGAPTTARSGSPRRSSSSTSRTTAAACRRTTPRPTSCVALASVLAEFGRGSIEFIPRSFLVGYDDADRALIEGDGPGVGPARAPEHADDDAPRARRVASQPRVRPRRAAAGPRAAPDVREQPPRRALPARHDLPLRRDAELPRHADPPCRGARGAPARPGAAGPDAPRARRPDRSVVRVRLAGPAGRAGRARPRTGGGSTAASPRSPTSWASTRSTRSSTSPSTRTSRPSSCSPRRPTPSGTPRPRRMIRSPFVMAGSSDGGAHLLSFCGADYTTRLLTEWVPDVLSLEDAVARLTSIPARATGLADRGRLERRRGGRRAADRPGPSRHARRAAVRARLPGRQRPLRRRRRPATGR